MRIFVLNNGDGTLHRYFLKEYGAWGVMTMAYLAGLVAARQVNLKALAGFLALALLINAKQAAAIWLRAAPQEKTFPGVIFIIHILLASVLLFPLFEMYGISIVLPYIIFPAAYLFFLKSMGEHAIYTEVLGFILLSLAALIAKAAVGSGVDARLFGVVAVFFTAGVFRVRIQFKKELRYRVFMVAYVIAAMIFYQAMNLRVVILMPLLDNAIFSITLYRVGLQATGWIEMAKGAIFLLLMAAFGY